MSTYEETYTLEERYEHATRMVTNLTNSLQLQTERVARLLGAQYCPICGRKLRFYSRASVSDPVHLILYACPSAEQTPYGYQSHYSISDFTEQELQNRQGEGWTGPDEPRYRYEKIEVPKDETAS